MRLVAAESAATLARRETEEFLKLYRRASIDLHTQTTRGAIADLFSDRADVVLIPRELSPEEDSLARAYRVKLRGFRIGVEALALVVNPSNPVRQIALDQLREIYTGRLASWSGLGGREAPIRLLWREPNSAAYELVVEKVLAGQKAVAPDAWIYSDSEMVERVGRDPDALGFVPAAALTAKVKALGVSEARGLPYFAPDPGAVYDQTYPLRHYDVLIYRDTAPKVVGGFATYALSNEGQRVVRDAGVIPTAVPIRIRRTQN